MQMDLKRIQNDDHSRIKQQGQNLERNNKKIERIVAKYAYAKDFNDLKSKYDSFMRA